MVVSGLILSEIHLYLVRSQRFELGRGNCHARFNSVKTPRIRVLEWVTGKNQAKKLFSIPLLLVGALAGSPPVPIIVACLPG